MEYGLSENAIMTKQSEGKHLATRANTKIELKARGWDAMSEET